MEPIRALEKLTMLADGPIKMPSAFFTGQDGQGIGIRRVVIAHAGLIAQTADHAKPREVQWPRWNHKRQQVQNCRLMQKPIGQLGLCSGGHNSRKKGRIGEHSKSTHGKAALSRACGDVQQFSFSILKEVLWGLARFFEE